MQEQASERRNGFSRDTANKQHHGGMVTGLHHVPHTRRMRRNRQSENCRVKVN